MSRTDFPVLERRTLAVRNHSSSRLRRSSTSDDLIHCPCGSCSRRTCSRAFSQKAIWPRRRCVTPTGSSSTSVSSTGLAWPMSAHNRSCLEQSFDVVSFPPGIFSRIESLLNLIVTFHVASDHRPAVRRHREPVPASLLGPSVSESAPCHPSSEALMAVSARFDRSRCGTICAAFPESEMRIFPSARVSAGKCRSSAGQAVVLPVRTTRAGEVLVDALDRGSRALVKYLVQPLFDVFDKRIARWIQRFGLLFCMMPRAYP